MVLIRDNMVLKMLFNSDYGIRIHYSALEIVVAMVRNAWNGSACFHADLYCCKYLLYMFGTDRADKLITPLIVSGEKHCFAQMK